MIAKTVQIKRTRYFLSEDELEKVLCKINEMNLSPSRYAETKGVGRSTFTYVLSGKLPMTKKMYVKAFKDLNCLKNLPKGYDD